MRAGPNGHMSFRRCVSIVSLAFFSSSRISGCDSRRVNSLPLRFLPYSGRGAVVAMRRMRTRGDAESPGNPGMRITVEGERKISVGESLQRLRSFI